MLLAFIGQTMAIHFMAPNDGASEQHTNIQQPPLLNDANGNNTHASETDDCCDVDCCENECICPANACASIAYLDNYLSLSELVVLSEPILSLTTKGTHFIARSLFRPPISTS